MLLQILTYTIAALIPSIICAAIWLVKSYIPRKIEHDFNLKIEQHKEEMNKRLEAFKSELAIEVAEHEFKFKRNYEQISIFLLEFSKQSVLASVALDKYLETDVLDEHFIDCATDAASKRNSLVVLFISNFILIPPNCSKSAKTIMSLLNAKELLVQKRSTAEKERDKAGLSQISKDHEALKMRFREANQVLLQDIQKDLDLHPIPKK